MSRANHSAPKRFSVTSLGETMMRLSVPPGQRFADARSFDVNAGGAESNVCVALANLGHACGWVSRLPDNPAGQLVLRRARAAGVDTSAVVLAAGERLGVYFVELSGPPRGIRTTYDRANSAMSNMRPDEVDWDYLLNTEVLHLTGITPALSESCAELVAEAVRRAKASGVKVSFDVNHRTLLWPNDKAAATLRPLIAQADLLICAKRDARALFGCHGETEDILQQLGELSSASWIIVTLGDEGLAAKAGEKIVFEPAKKVQIVDRVGAGDALAAGILDGYLEGSLEEALRRGVTLAALALSQHGDMLITTRDELMSLLSGDQMEIRR